MLAGLEIEQMKTFLIKTGPQTCKILFINISTPESIDGSEVFIAYTCCAQYLNSVYRKQRELINAQKFVAWTLQTWIAYANCRMASD